MKNENLDFILVKRADVPELHKPVLVEGLPGVGNVGKLAAEHLLEEIGAVHFADIYSKHFPPQVLVDDDGLVNLVSNSLYYCKRKDGGSGDSWKDRDIVMLVGDFQGITPEGQYSLCYEVLKVFADMGVERVFTLGGFGVGKMVEEPRVLGAASNMNMVEDLKTHGVVFGNGEQPSSGIVGASGLILGLAPLLSMEGVCLMGETSGYFVDPKSAEAVLKVLSSVLGLEVSMEALEKRAKEIEIITAKLKEMEGDMDGEPSLDDTLRYIG